MISLKNIPINPGCYLFKDKSGKIIYVGKAKDLKKRVSSYFQKKDLDPKTSSLVNNIESVDFIATNNEVEALILENNLIKKNKPKYNIDLKDSKRYAFIEITNEEFPKLLLARKKIGDGEFFGPFVSAEERDNILEILIKTFQLRTCKKLSKKPCLRHHIALCNAPCAGLINKDDYQKKIEKIRMILSGKSKELGELMIQEMIDYSASLNYEKAIELRNQVNALQKLDQRQAMERKKLFNEDIINYIISDNFVYLMIFNIYKGTLLNKQEYVFDYIEHFLEDFLVQYYSDNDIPKELVLPEEIDNSMVSFLEEKKKNKIIVTIPKIGEKKTLLELVKKNIELTFFKGREKLSEIKKKLRLTELPVVIECFDVSHLSGTSVVGSMIQFRNGIPDKSNYRRFKISEQENDDFSAIAEIVRRRYTRQKNEKKEMPNLIIIDGGKGQLNSALGELKKLNLKIPVVSIAKKFEEIYVPGLLLPIVLKAKDPALLLIREIRDEAHRFAIKYNKLLRKKKLVEPLVF